MSPHAPQLQQFLRVAFSKEELVFLEEHPRFQRLLLEWDGTPEKFMIVAREGGVLIHKFYGGKASPKLRNRFKKNKKL